MAEIIPAIIPESLSHLYDEVAKVKDFINLVQVDIADGIFVKNKTWPYIGDHGEFEKLLREETGLPFWEDVNYEFHLMIESPEKTLEDWIKIGASGIIVQIETISNIETIVEMCKANEVTFGLSIKPSTSIEKVAQYSGKIDFLQCMGSDDLGHHDAVLDSSVFEKIKDLRRLYPNMPIAIDIGVSRETAPDFVSLGVTKLVSGGAIFQSGNISETIKFFRNI